MRLDRLACHSCHLGPLGVLAAWLVIGVSWWLNRGWFVFTRDAYSDLGGPGACCPLVYNLGLILVGMLLVGFGICVAMAAERRVGVAGGSYLALAGVFLALIGVFPSGTRPHTFVSTWFFVQADIALIASLAEAAWRKCKMSKPTLLLAVLAFPIAGSVEAVVGWPSAAVLETYGIIVIDLGVLVLWLCFRGICGRGTWGRGAHP